VCVALLVILVEQYIMPAAMNSMDPLEGLALGEIKPDYLINELEVAHSPSWLHRLIIISISINVLNGVIIIIIIIIIIKMMLSTQHGVDKTETTFPVCDLQLVRRATVSIKWREYLRCVTSDWFVGRLLERVLKLSVPVLYFWLVMFYMFFHLWMNILAELLCFGDREFYKDWSVKPESIEA
jgi:hypothetical protein